MNTMPLEETILENEKLLHFVARRFSKRAAVLSVEYDDLISEAKIGLIKAIRNFDEKYGVKFSTYAVPMIEGNIRRFLRDVNPGVKFSRQIKELAYKVSDDDSLEEIMDKLQISKKKALDVIEFKKHQIPISMTHAYGNDDDKDMTIEDAIGNYEDFSNIEVQDFLSSLPERYRTIVQMLMLNKKQSEIGEVIGCSQVQVSRLIPKIQELYKSYQKGEIKMAKITLEQYNEFKAQGLKDGEIAEKTGVSKQTIYNYKSKWFKDTVKPVVQKVKQLPEMKVEDKTAEYTNLIQQLKDRVKKQEITIVKLQKKVEEYENLNGACSDVEEETANLRKEVDYLSNKRLEETELYLNTLEQLKQKDYELENTKRDLKHTGDAMKLYEVENAALREVVRSQAQLAAVYLS